VVLGVGQMHNQSPRWHSEDFAILDLRRMRSILQDLPPDMRQTVVNNLREAYPTLSINLSSHGLLQIENNQ
jgi:hypothetical protein